MQRIRHAELDRPGHDFRRRPHASALASLSVCAVLLATARAHAGHDVFHIFTPVVEAGHFGAEALSTFNAGMPQHDEHEEHGHGAPRAAHELAFHGGITDFWMAKLALGLSREDGEAYAATSLALENVLRLTPPSAGAFDFAWFTSVSAGLDSGASNFVEFGPILSLDAGRWSMVLNPFLEKSFGENREDGVAFAYAFRASYEIAEKLSVGIEGYGEVENIADAPPASEQTHRIGPVIYIGHMHGARRHRHSVAAAHGPHDEAHHGHGDHAGHAHAAAHGGPAPGAAHAGDWHAEIGVLFGLTEATPDAALKFNVGTDF